MQVNTQGAPERPKGRFVKTCSYLIMVIGHLSLTANRYVEKEFVYKNLLPRPYVTLQSKITPKSMEIEGDARREIQRIIS